MDNLIPRRIRKFVDLSYSKFLIRSATYTCRPVSTRQRYAVVYDPSCTAPGFGDLLELVFLARMLGTRKRCDFFIITGNNFRGDWPGSIAEKVARLANFLSLIDKLCNHTKSLRIDVKMITWPIFELEVLGKQTHAIPFRNLVRRRVATYHFAPDLMSHLYAQANERSWLMKPSELPIPDQWAGILSYGEYVAFCIRFSPYDQKRNTSPEQILLTIDELLRKHPHNQLVILCDTIAMEYAKNTLGNSSRSIIFSAEQNIDFVDEMAVVINSKIFYQLLGGGMSWVAACSEVPYRITSEFYVPQRMYRRSKFLAWQTGEQIFVEQKYAPSELLSISMFDSI